MLFILAENQKPKSYKRILAKLKNKILEDLMLQWIHVLPYRISFSALEKQVVEILKIVKNKSVDEAKDKIICAIKNKYGTFIFHEQKIKKVNWEAKIKKLKKNKIKI